MCDLATTRGTSFLFMKFFKMSAIRSKHIGEKWSLFLTRSLCFGYPGTFDPDYLSLKCHCRYHRGLKCHGSCKTLKSKVIQPVLSTVYTNWVEKIQGDDSSEFWFLFSAFCAHVCLSWKIPSKGCCCALYAGWPTQTLPQVAWVFSESNKIFDQATFWWVPVDLPCTPEGVTPDTSEEKVLIFVLSLTWDKLEAFTRHFLWNQKPFSIPVTRQVSSVFSKSQSLGFKPLTPTTKNIRCGERALLMPVTNNIMLQATNINYPRKTQCDTRSLFWHVCYYFQITQKEDGSLMIALLKNAFLNNCGVFLFCCWRDFTGLLFVVRKWNGSICKRPTHRCNTVANKNHAVGSQIIFAFKSKTFRVCRSEHRGATHENPE